MILSDLQIELAGICNADCGYCTWKQRTVGKQLMDFDLATRMLYEAYMMRVPLVTYHGVGESTLHPRLVEIMQYGEGLGLKTRLSTNCFNLKGKLANELRRIKNLELILAVPWVEEDKFVDRCVENAVDYLQSPSENREVVVQMVCDESAEKHIGRFFTMFGPLVGGNKFLYLKQPRTWPNDTPNKGFNPLHLPWPQPQLRMDTFATPISLGRGCNMPERFLMVLADGTCVPCCVGMDESWGLGNIKGRTLRDVWESREMEIVRAKWKSADESVPCHHCLTRGDC